MTIIQTIGFIFFTILMFLPLVIVFYHCVYIDIKNAIIEYINKNHKNTVKR